LRSGGPALPDRHPGEPDPGAALTLSPFRECRNGMWPQAVCLLPRHARRAFGARMRGFVLTLSGLIVGLAMGVAASDVDWGFAVRARPATPAGSVVQWVDRTHKGS